MRRAPETRRGRTTAGLIAELERDLRPVEPIRSVTTRACLLGALWVGLALPLTVWPGANAVGNPGFLPTLLCLTLLAAGGGWAALCACVPGHEPGVRAGLGLGAIGGVGIVVLAFDQGVGEGLAQGFPAASVGYVASALYHDWMCVALAVALALPIWGALLVFGRRSWVLQPGTTALLASVASVGAGAALVHMICGEGCARHALGSHGLAPAWGGLLLVVPAVLALRMRGRASA